MTMTMNDDLPQIRWVRKIDPNLDLHLRYLYRLTAEQKARWEAAVTEYKDNLKRDVTDADIKMAIEGNNPESVLDRMAWSEADAAFVQAVGPIFSTVVERAGKAELGRLQLDMRFDLDNPYVFRWIDTRTAELVTQVSPETKKAIANVIRDAFTNGDPPRESARVIRGLVGLTDRDARAVQNYWRTVALDGNRSAKAAEKMADTYSKKLLRRRAENIARTETINASSKGAQISWREAQNQGFTLPGSMQEWIASVESPRTCPICLDLDAKRVPLGQPFYSAVSGRYYDGPTAHPSCRCAVSIVTEIPQ